MVFSCLPSCLPAQLPTGTKAPCRSWHVACFSCACSGSQPHTAHLPSDGWQGVEVEGSTLSVGVSHRCCMGFPPSPGIFLASLGRRLQLACKRGFPRCSRRDSKLSVCSTHPALKFIFIIFTLECKAFVMG